MKKIIINSKLKEEEILKKLQSITEFFIAKGKLAKGDELVIGMNDGENDSTLIELDASLMSPEDYKLAKKDILQLGKVVSSDLKNFDDDGDPLIHEDDEKDPKTHDNPKPEEDPKPEDAPKDPGTQSETPKEEKQGAVDSNSVKPALQVHDSKELLFNKENMFSGLKSLLFSDEELKKAPETPKAEDPKPEDPKPEDKAEKPEEPKKEETPQNPDNQPEGTHDNTEPKPEGDPNETPADKADKVAEEEKKNPATPEVKSFDDLYFSNEELDPMSTLYFSEEEIHPYQSLYFSEDELKKSDFENAEPKGAENEDPAKKVEDLKKEAAKDPEPAKDPELHDTTPAEPKREPAPVPAPEAPKAPAKKSLEELLKEYETTKKPYTKEAVASEAGCTVEEVAKKMKEMKLMDEEGILKADPATNPEVKKDEPKNEDSIDKVEALKNLAKLNKEAKAGRELNFVEKHFCKTFSKMFSEEEIAEAEKNAAEVNAGNVTKSKMEMLKELNAKNTKGNLANYCKEMNRK